MITIKTANYTDLILLANKFDIIGYSIPDSLIFQPVKLSEPIGRRSLSEPNDLSFELSFCIIATLEDGFQLCGNVAEGSLILINVVPKTKSQSDMRIYIRCNRGLFYNDRIIVSNPMFRNGNYFYDMCLSDKKYEVKEREEIDLKTLSNHAISITDLDSLLSANPCHH